MQELLRSKSEVYGKPEFESNKSVVTSKVTPKKKQLLNGLSVLVSSHVGTQNQK